MTAVGLALGKFPEGSGSHEVEGPDRAAAASAPSGRALIEAVSILAEREGVDLPADRTGDLETLARRAGLLLRPVTLGGEWWRRSGPDLLGHAAGRPVALVAGSAGYGVASSPYSPPIPLDAAGARAIAPQAIQLYAPLPAQITRSALLSFTLRGVARDGATLALAVFLMMLVSLIAPIAMGTLVGTALPDGRMGMVGEMVFLLCAGAIGAAGFQIMRSLTLTRILNRVDLRLQAALWGRVLDLPTRFFRDYTVGDLAQRVLGVDHARRALGGAALGGLLGAVSALGSLVLMLTFDARLALYGLIYGVSATALLALLGWLRVRRESKVFAEVGATSGLLVELFGAIGKLRMSGAEERALGRFAGLFEKQVRRRLAAGRIANLEMVFSTLLSPVGMLGIFLLVGRDGITLATFAAFNVAFGQFVGGLASLSQTMNAALVAAPLLARARPVFTQAPETLHSNAPPPVLSGRITLNGVDFAYDDKRSLTLSNIDLDIAPGEFVAIVGASGSGKSTLMRLMLGFETPRAGQVLYDGESLSGMDLRLLRRQIGAVMQTVELTPGSLYENIAASSMASRDEVMAAARAVGLAPLVERLPMGLETVVTEGGSTFSGGQRQLILIARALVRRPRIVLFDEATSALDNATQAIVSDAIDRIEATRIVIAHRLSTIRHADRIIVMDKGRIVEEGRFDTLLARGGAFHHLAQRQML